MVKYGAGGSANHRQASVMDGMPRLDHSQARLAATINRTTPATITIRRQTISGN